MGIDNAVVALGLVESHAMHAEERLGRLLDTISDFTMHTDFRCTKDRCICGLIESLKDARLPDEYIEQVNFNALQRTEIWSNNDL